MLALAVMAGGEVLFAWGCGGQARQAGPVVDAGLAGLLGDDAAPAEIVADEPVPAADPGTVPESDLQAMIDRQAAELALAYGQPPPSEPDPGPQVSLGDLLSEEQATAGEAGPPPVAGASGAAAAEAPGTPDTLELNDLYARLDEALGRELASTSEPFRMAVVAVALAAAQGKNPADAIAEGAPAGDRLSPEEHDSALAIAGLLGSLLAPRGEAPEDRAAVLRQFGEELGKTVGLRIPTARLCTRVRGFGKYEEFASTSFLAGRPVRALVYVEVEQFEHGRVDTASLDGIPVEEEWSIELSQTLELYHDGETGMLAWKRPEEIVVETSRNRQRDFYLLTEVTLPQTLTIGSYKLKVIVRDRVGDQRAEALIPMKIVADPALAWTPG